jgi:photosystem II stability/assembly factor-like uncharacterized protein
MKNKIIVVLLTYVSLSFIASDCSNQSTGTNNPPASNDIGVIMTTEDGGETWSTRNVSLGAEVTLICSFPLDMDTFCIALDRASSDVIMKTTNSGNSFYEVFSTDKLITDLTGTINDGIAFATLNNGILLRTTDYGSSWNEIYSDTTRFMKVVKFAGEMNGIILCGTGTLVTTDGGVNWLPRPAISGSAEIDNISFISSSPGTELVACERFNKIFRTVDLGMSWTEISNPVNENFQGVDFVDPVGILVGSQILRSTDRGLNWYTVPSPGHALVVNAYAEGTYYWILTTVNILRSTDQGQSWIDIAPGSLIGYNDAMFSKNRAIIVGERIR